MKHFSTKITAINPLTGDLTEYAGPIIPAPSKKLANEFCQEFGFGYCEVNGELIAEIPVENDTPRYDLLIDYETINSN